MEISGERKEQVTKIVTLPARGKVGHRTLTRPAIRASIPAMDSEENLPRPGDAIALLVKQDLDPLSVAELEERIALLEGEIARVKKHMQRAVNHRASADSLFKR